MSTKRLRAQRKANLASQDLEKVNEKGSFKLPLDLITQVCQYLEPKDILYLARTTRLLRALLLDRYRSRHVWKTAFSNIPDMPPCPDHLSEPAYAHLAFIPECHGCFQRCDATLWELRMRCCDGCFPKMTVSCSKQKSFARADVVSISQLVGLPFTSVSTWDYYRTSDWEALSTLVKNRPLESFVAKEKGFWAPVGQHARSCRSWQYPRLMAEKSRIERIRCERAEEIERRLRVLGWTDDIYYSTCFKKLPAVQMPEPLTSAEWSKIASEVVASLPEIRLAHIAEIYHYRLHGLRGYLQTYQPIDVLLLRPVRNVIESNVNVHMNANRMLEKINPSLVQLMLQGNRDKVHQLTSFAKQQLGPNSGVDPRDALFTCTQCPRTSSGSQRHMGFNAALSHEHLYTSKSPRKRSVHEHTQESEIYEDVVLEEYGPPRSLEVLRVDKGASKEVLRLSKALGCKFSIVYE